MMSSLTDLQSLVTELLYLLIVHLAFYFTILQLYNYNIHLFKVFIEL